MGFPIRKSADQSSFAAPRGLSQRSTSFIASQRQGIHQTPLRHLIALIINARPRNQLSVTSNQILRSDHWLLVTDHWSSALTERPACFEIDPSARAVKQRVGCGSPTACAAATFSDRSPLHDVRQRARRPRPAEALRCAAREMTFLFGRASILLVEPDGIEPTTSCLQSRRSPN